MSREFLTKLVVGTSLAGGGILMAGCEAKTPAATLPLNSPTPVSTETPVPPTLTPILPTRTLPVPTAIPSLGLDPKILQGVEAARRHDNEIRERIEQAKSGETLILQGVHIRHIATFPWEGGNAYIATLDTGDDLTAVILSADCIYDRFRDRGQLGTSTLLLVGRVWSPIDRVGLLSLKVGLATGTPILNAEQVTHGGITESCKEVKASDRLKEFVNKVDWKKAPRGAGEFAGWLAREVIEGISLGFSTPTPAR